MREERANNVYAAKKLTNNVKERKLRNVFVGAPIFKHGNVYVK